MSGWVGRRAAEIEAQRGPGLVFAVEDDEVPGVHLRSNRLSQLRGAEHRREGLQAKMRREQEAEGARRQGEVGAMHLAPPAQIPGQRPADAE